MRKIRRIESIINFQSDLPKVKKGQILVVPMDNRLAEIAPYSNRGTMPDWWKNQPKKMGTIRRCHGTLDYLGLGITFRLWTNVHVRPTANMANFEIRLEQFGNHRGYGPGSEFRVENFPAASSEGCPFSENRAIKGDFPKLVTPWFFKTAPGYSTLILPNHLDQDPNYSVMPGVVHTDYYHTINVVLLIHTDKEFTIPIGTPIYQLIPYKRSDQKTDVILGNDSMAKFMEGRGVGEHYVANMDRRQSYRKELAKQDVAVSEMENHSLVRRLLRRD